MAESNSSGNSGWMQAAMPILTTAANMVGRGGPKRQFKYNKRMAQFQNDLNRANAEWAFNKELELRKYQADYDSPRAQMQRYKDAGLNPALMYGQGSPGSFEAPSAPNVPGVAAHQVDASVLGAIGSEFQQARLMAAQADLTQTKTQESTVKQDLMKAQEAVTKVNPYLRKEYVDAMVLNLKSAAEMKAQQSDFLLSKTVDTDGTRWERGFLKMQRELDMLGQKFDLQKADQKIKGEILQSKEFQNALQKIQLDWMRDADITPQHIYQGIFMLLQSLMRR